MSAAAIQTLTCTQCGGELHPDEGQIFLACPYCAATVFVEKARVLFHWSVAPTLDPQQAAAALRRWMSGSQTVKNLDQKAQVVSQTFEYFPLWYFVSRSAQGDETANLEPAAATSVTELRGLALPAGDLRPYAADLDEQSILPDVPRETALAWLEESRPGVEVRETALVHVPLYTFKYQFQGKLFTAVVEAATGRVLANIFPSKPEAPYILAGLITAGVYLLLASLPIFGGEALFGIALILALAAAPILFGFAAWVANQV